MLFDDKSILAEYVYNDPSFNNGLNNFEWILLKNINNSGKFDKIYHYKSEDEEYFSFGQFFFSKWCCNIE